MVHAIDANRGKADWCGNCVAKDGRCSVASVSVDELAEDDMVPVESLAVGEMGAG